MEIDRSDMVKEFKNDQEYLAWLSGHPSGYVLNLHRKPKRQYLVLHRATCRSIAVKPEGHSDGGFTERVFRKLVSEEEQLLRNWLREQPERFTDFSSVCGLCHKSPRK